MTAPPSEKGFCIWHAECQKSDWETELLVEQIFSWSSVDGPEPATFDWTGVGPRRKVPCTAHVQKNAVGRLVDVLFSLHGGDNQAMVDWIMARKWGMPVDFPCSHRRSVARGGASSGSPGRTHGFCMPYNLHTVAYAVCLRRLWLWEG